MIVYLVDERDGCVICGAAVFQPPDYPPAHFCAKCYANKEAGTTFWVVLAVLAIFMAAQMLRAFWNWNWPAG
jgi:hypothetical protein